MSFSERDKLKALAIVHVFETSKPFGDYSALAVLNDGAGISYGINQFTHKSGSLELVLNEFVLLGGELPQVLKTVLPDIQNPRSSNILLLSKNSAVKAALKKLGGDPLMRQAQNEVAFDHFLRPAITACDGSAFKDPLSLAVIYDSINHGSWEKVRDRVSAGGGERGWIERYVRTRDAWLNSVPRLRSTRYRTQFFLNEIRHGNWELKLPLYVHGCELTEDIFPPMTSPAVEQSIVIMPVTTAEAPESAATSSPASQAQTPGTSESVLGAITRAGQFVEAAGKPIDAAAQVTASVTQRKDSVKSMWTALLHSVWQVIWAVLGFFIGLPKEVWFVVAIIVAAFGLYYLYRQITLGKIREQAALQK